MKKPSTPLVLLSFFCTDCKVTHYRPDILFFWHAWSATDTTYANAKRQE